MSPRRRAYPHVPHLPSRKPGLPVMVPPPSREHPPASSSNPPSSGHSAACVSSRRFQGRAGTEPRLPLRGRCPLSGEPARKPSSVWTRTLYPYGSRSPGKGGPTCSSAPSPQDTFCKHGSRAHGDAHGWSSGSALGFCPLDQVKPLGLGSPLLMSPHPQEAASQTKPSLPTSPQEGGSGRELSTPAWPPEASPPKPPSPANPVRKSVCQAMPLGTPPPRDARPPAGSTLSSSRTLGRREDACQTGHVPAAAWLGNPAGSSAHCPMLPPAHESPEDRTRLLRQPRPRAPPSGERARQGTTWPRVPPCTTSWRARKKAWRAQGPAQPGRPGGGLRTHPGP